MKKNSIAFTLALALAALAAPFAQTFAAGDIASIEAIDDPEQGSYYPNGSTPLVAGQDLYVRILLKNKNENVPDAYTGARGNWSWDSLAFTETTGPQLALAIGGRRAYAAWSSVGPDFEEIDNKHFTPIYFKYTVQPGDVGLPVCLLRTDGKVHDDDSDLPFLIVNVNNSSTPLFNLKNDYNSDSASFSYVSSSDLSRLQGHIDTTLKQSYKYLAPWSSVEGGVNVQSIAFDDNKYGDIWRKVYKSVSDSVDGYVPYIVSYGADANTVVYIWSEDDDKVVPVANALQGTTIDSSSGKQVLVVPLPAATGTSTIPFALKGGAHAQVDGEVKIYMSPTKFGSFSAVGAAIGESSVVTTVKIVDDPEPTIRLFFGTDPTASDANLKTAECQTDYASQEAGVITVRVSPAATKPVTVNLAATLSDVGDLDAIFGANILCVGPSYAELNGTVTIQPPESGGEMESVVKYYTLGATDKSVSEGIKFSVGSFSTDDTSVTAGSDSPTLKINKLEPAVTAPDRLAVNIGKAEPFSVSVVDCYMAGDGSTWEGYEFDVIPDLDKPDESIGFGDGKVSINTNSKNGSFKLDVTVPSMTPGTYDARLVVKSPTGATGYADFQLTVKRAKTVNATASAGSVEEGTSVNVKFSISESNNGANTYAFLVPEVGYEDLVDRNSAPFASGVLIAAGTTESEEVEVVFLDGNNKNAVFNVVLSDNENDSGSTVGYASSYLNLRAVNKNPVVKEVGFGNKKVTGGSISASAGVDYVLSVKKIDDVAADKTGLKVYWTVDGEDKEAVDWDTTSYGGITCKFGESGKVVPVAVYVADKDGGQSEVYEFSVNVGNVPSVTIGFYNQNDDGIWAENTAEDHALAVSLSPAPAEDTTVRLTVPKGAQGGFIRLQTTGDDVVDAGSDDSAYYYDVKVPAGQTSPVRVDVAELDGTSSTSAIYITGKSVEGGSYKEGRSPKINVKNIAPTISVPTEIQAATTNKNVSVYQPFSVSYRVGTDVKADLERGIRAELIVDGDKPIATETVTDRSTHTFETQVEFTMSGSHYVTVVFTDLDGNSGNYSEESSSRTVYYEVMATKNVMVAAHNPAASRVSANGHSVRYSKAKGLGAGKTTATDQNPKNIKSHVSTYAVSVAASGLNVVAEGYTVADPTNDVIDASGNTKAEAAKSFDYTTDTITGREGYDSFFYAWTCNNSQPSDGIELANDLLIAPGRSSEYDIPLQPYEADKKAYDNQYWEAVFSREWRKGDNVGDINNDGVPDIFVSLYDFGVINRTTSTVLDGDDLATLSGYNTDSDFLPAGEQIVKPLLIPGDLADWGNGIPFDAQLEIRGYHEGLNYGMFPVTDTDGWISDISLSSAEEAALRRFRDSVGDEYDGPTEFDLSTEEGQSAAKAFITWTWRGYSDGGEWGFTVENRTDPTVADTDGDTMPDGYEYYYWYASTVGFDEAGSQIVGEKFTIEDIERHDPITSEEIAKIFNPNLRPSTADYWDKQDTDGDGLYDYEEMAIGTSPIHWDTDGDGVSDLFEVMWNIDPLKSDSKDTNNAEYNGDGDYMAYVEGYMNCLIVTLNGVSYAWTDTVTNYVENGTNFYVAAGFQVARFNGAWIPVDDSFSEVIENGTELKLWEVPGDPEEGTEREGNYAVANGRVDLYHHQVYSRLGFDPRTAWFKPDRDTANNYPNTKKFTAKDEMLLLKYRYITGLRQLYYKDENNKGDLRNLEEEKTTIAAIFKGGATNPSPTFEDKTYGSGRFVYNRSASNLHGADTDGDAVPDGWELYVGANPNKADTARDMSVYSKLDLLAREFAGTTSCAVYSDCPTIFANRPRAEGSVIRGWLNKFWPVDPANTDTDGDGITDKDEGAVSWDEAITYGRWSQTKNAVKGGTTVWVRHRSIYGPLLDVSEDDDDIRPNNDGCYAGGGYNPCSIDTDKDGLPDLWERQYSGILFYTDNVASNAFVETSPVPDPELDDEIRASALAFYDPKLHWKYYVAMGMDGTVADSQKDFDFDGLANWQEYTVQALRHLRYDDSVHPLNGYDMPSVDPETGDTVPGAFTGKYMKLSLAESYNELDDESREAVLKHLREDLGYGNFADFVASETGEDYLAKLGYFAPPPYAWDPANKVGGVTITTIDSEGNETTSSTSKAYRYMLPPRAPSFTAREYPVYISTNSAGDVIWEGYEYEAVLNGEKIEWNKIGDTKLVYTNEQVKVVDGEIVASIPNFLQFQLDLESQIEGSAVCTNAYLLVTDDEGEIKIYRMETEVGTEKALTAYWSFFAAKYVSTDPRLWDTDEDGMDDYWELFHGLNPILGGVDGSGKDIIEYAYGSISATRNAHTGWKDISDEVNYDPVKMPWLVGSASCDADGDGLRNSEESILANLSQMGTTHTDPTPLWMTDTTVPFEETPVVATTTTTNIIERMLANGLVIPVKQITTTVATNAYVKVYGSPSYAAQYYEMPWTNNVKWVDGGYFLDFEENEGYDTDGDWRADRSEIVRGAEPTSDVLDFNDPQRRQSITFGDNGKEGVVIGFSPLERSHYVKNADFLKHFTVEAWVRPTTVATGERQYVVSRAVNRGGWDFANSTAVIRNNFAMGITADGKAFAEFNDSTDGSVVAEGAKLVDGEWAHLAATYDGAALCIIVNGVVVGRQTSSLAPENGVTGVAQDPWRADSDDFPVAAFSSDPAVIIVGGRANGKGAFGAEVAAAATEWGDVAADFFKGSVDEVRVWDGVRSEGDIKADLKKRYTSEDVKTFRLATFNGGDVELVHHFSFGSLPGAIDRENVQKVPAGFAANVLDAVGDDVGADALKVGWWNSIITNDVFKDSQVYSSGHVVPWIRDTVGHLPTLRGMIADSAFWSEYLAGYTPVTFLGVEKFEFPNTMNPYTVATRPNVAIVAVKGRLHKNNFSDESLYDSLDAKSDYDSAHSFSGTRDLLPLGDVFAKRLDESWDGEGPEDAWTVTTVDGEEDGDKNADGVPDWYDGTAEEYLRDLAKGLLPGATEPDSDWADNVDTDKDGIPDWWEKLYDVFADGADDDTDLDGLSNYQEYLIREVYGLAKVDPRLAYSTQGQKVTDYYLRYGTLYYGELFADHDMIEDVFEDSMSVERFFAQRVANYSRFTYDAARDVDGIGWNNWQLARDYIAGMYVTNEVVSTVDASGNAVSVTNQVVRSSAEDRNGNPNSKVPIHVFYNGKLGNLGVAGRKHSVVLKAYALDASGRPSLTSNCDSCWTAVADNQNALDFLGTVGSYSSGGKGIVSPGRNLFVAYIVEGDYSSTDVEVPYYTEGMPFGYAIADVGSQSGDTIDIEVTDFSPTMMRINLASAIEMQRAYAAEVSAEDRDWWSGVGVPGSEYNIEYYARLQSYYTMMRSTTDRGLGSCPWATLQRASDYCGTNLTFAASNTVHVWVAQLLINSQSNADGKYYKPLYNIGEVNLSTHPVLTEADLVGYGYYDLGWDTLVDAYRSVDQNKNKSSLTNATFGLIIERAPVSYPNANNLLLLEMVNHYELGLVQTEVANREVRTYCGQPTFSWTHQNTIGKDYPAFRLKVWKKGGSLVFDSGVQRAPVRDAAGRYNWTAPLWVGSMTSENVVFDANEAYVWDVSMLDAKFTDFAGSAAKGQTFRMQDTTPSGGDTDYGIIPVKVKYTGPGTVSTTTAAKCLRVEAYRVPDFSGAPFGVGYVTDATDLKATDKISVNAVITGLPTSMDFYILAYIDTNGNGRRDEWESWGYADYYMDATRFDIYTPRAFRAANAAATDDCLVYVNDADTNCNMLPDVWEWEKDGKLGGSTASGAGSVSPYYSYYLSDSEKKSVVSGLGSKFGAPALSSSFAYAAMLSAAQSGGTITPEQAFILTGVDWTKLEATPKVSITSFSLVDGVTLVVDPTATFDGEEVSSTDPLVVTVYVTLKVQYTEDLASGAWTDAASATLNLTLASGEQTVGGDVLDSVNAALLKTVDEHGSGCYFRVMVEVGER